MQSAIRCNRVRLRTNLLDFKVLLLLGTNHVRTLHRGIIGAKWGESSLEVCKNGGAYADCIIVSGFITYLCIPKLCNAHGTHMQIRD